ncbi:MAG: orotate phosphoribosyltransferase [Fidelibacterota bacterium]
MAASLRAIDNVQDVLELLTSRGAILEGHFLLTSGKHSDVYLEKFRVLEDPEVVDRVGGLLADGFSGGNVTAVLGAAVGGILLSHAAAKALGTRGIFAERVEGKLSLRRGFQLSGSDAVLIVEDVVTTGGSVRELMDLARKRKARVAGVSCLVDRSPGGISFDIRTRVLVRYPAQTWEEDSCPLCRKGIPLELRGSVGKS